MRLIIGDARGARDGPDIKQMMDDALPVVERQLCGADVHALVQLHRVGVHDLTVQAMRNVDAELRLARRGRAEDDDDPRSFASNGSRASRRSHAGSQVATVYITPYGASA